MAKYSFNSGWQFWADGRSEKQTVELPHDAMIHETRDPNCANAENSGFYPGGKYFYQKNLNVPKSYRDLTVILEFEGVYQKASVYINRQKAAYHPYGYTPFFVDCGPCLKYGESNVITVEVDNSRTPNGRWYTGSGIYRPVSLIVKNKNHIPINGIHIKTVSCDPPRIEVRTEHTGGEVSVKILRDGSCVASAEGDRVTILIPDGELWSEETPVLYQCEATVKSGGTVTDQECVDFGVRMLSWSNRGFFVNGKETKLRGACIHHDNGVLGACAFEEAEDRRVSKLKEAGFNAIRSAHNPCSQALLRAADRHGVYVMDELTDVWYKHKHPNDYADDFEEWHLKDLRSMVERDYNHPSVIMYSIGNEIGEAQEAKGVQAAKEMAELCHLLDDARPVTIGTNLMICDMERRGKGIPYSGNSNKKAKGKKDSKKKNHPIGSQLFNILMNIMGSRMDQQSAKPGCDLATAEHFSYMDICGYNYGTVRYRNEPSHYPNRIIVGSETRPPCIAENWRTVMKCPHVIGDFMWTGWDYLGEAGIGTVSYSRSRNAGFLLKKYPFLLSGAGIIDICGNFRPDVFLARAAWGKLRGKPYIGVEPEIYAGERPIFTMWRKSDAVHSWSWEGCERSPANIIVYSDAAQVELFLNGRPLGRKPVFSCAARFKTIYQPGELVAVGYSADGKELGRDILRTAGSDVTLKAKPEKTHLHADGQDLCYLNIELSDQNGEIAASKEAKVRVEVSGAGTLQGFGSANPYTQEGFDGNTHDTFYGRALAVIRAAKESGDITVTVSAEGFSPQKIILRAE